MFGMVSYASATRQGTGSAYRRILPGDIYLSGAAFYWKG